jgi:hypothetical protein
MRRSVLALAPLAFTVSAVGCASGNDDNGSSNDASTDTGTHDSSLADTQFGDAPKDSNADAPHDGGTETTSDSGVDSGVDTAVIDSDTDSSIVDSAIDSAIDSALDSAIDSATDVPVTDVVVLGYRHTILIDGTNDFTTASERFHTTSGDASGYFAYVTWDATNLYVGYEGSDISGASSGGTKWVFAYLDVDPGAGTGATMGVTYNTETPGFPAGFGAEYYLRWKCDDSFSTLEVHGAGGWSTDAAAGVTHHRTGSYVEFSIPLASLGTPSKVGVVTLLMNEAAGVEAAYAGIYADNFTDGYHATVPIAHYLLGDFASSLSPNDPSNEK